MLNPHEINEIRKNPMSEFLKTAEDFGNAVLYPTCEKRNEESKECQTHCKTDAKNRMEIALSKKKDERICGVLNPENLRQFLTSCENKDKNKRGQCLQYQVTTTCAELVYQNKMRGCFQFCVEKSRQIMFGEHEGQE